MDYFSAKAKHAYECFKSGKSRKKVYCVVEHGDKFFVLKTNPDARYKYMLAGGSIEDGEDVVNAGLREVLEEMNLVVEFVKSLGHIATQSTWTYGDETFKVNDDMEILYTRFVEFGDNKQLGLDGEFDSQDIVAKVSKEDMLNNVAQFAKYGLKLK